MKKKKKKCIERICGNCRLFDEQKQECAVVILHEGEKYHLPVETKDACFYEQEYFDPTTKAVEDFNEIQEVQFWVENEKGEKVDGNGTVKMRYPPSFLGGDTEEEKTEE